MTLCGVQAGAFESAVDPLELLHKSAMAGHDLSYSGTQFVAIYGEPETLTIVADIAHTTGKGSILKIHAAPGIPARTVFEPDSSSDPWSALGSGLGGASYGSTALQLLGSHYSATMAGAATVAGRKATIVELKRVSGETAARFWIDTATALPLRREVYDLKGQLTRVSAYLDFALKPAIVRPRLVVKTTLAPAPAGQLLTGPELDAARASGWVLPDILGTLQLVEIRRGSATLVPGVVDDQSAVMHLVYSDGLSTVSVFQQLGRLTTPSGWVQESIGSHKVWVNTGIPTAVSWSAKGRVYTVVAEGPPAQLQALIEGLPHATHHGGVLHRLHRGIDRVGSWLNPFA